MKIAIVHDWLTNLGGAERVVYELHKLYPDAPIYTSVYKKSALPMFESADVRTTWLQKIPGKLKFKHQLWTPIRPLVFRRLDLSEFDIVISSTTAEAKQVKVRDDAIHICYCNTPTRYLWVNPEEYKKNPGLGPLNILAPVVMPLFLRALKKSDFKAAQKVDYFIGNSKNVQARIKKYYKRDAEVIYPPVDVERFTPTKKHKRTHYLIAGRQIPYKRLDLAVKACTKLKLPLIVAGNGPEHQKLKDMAGSTITFETDVTDERMVELFQTAKAFIFPGEEDFGITPVEAMAAGTPVIAYAKGGVTETITDGKSGIFFERQTVKSLISALEKFNKSKFDEQKLKEYAAYYENDRFLLEMSEFVNQVSPRS